MKTERLILPLSIAVLFVITYWPLASALASAYAVPGDFEHDGDVDLRDFALLAAAWQTHSNSPGWNPALDISEPNDGIVNNLDLLIFSQHWLHNDMVLVPAGEFLMGDHFNEGLSSERPVHPVCVDSFYIGRCEITNGQYCQFLNSAPLKVVTGVVYASSDDSNSCPYFTTGTASPDSQIAYSDGIFSVRTKCGRDMSQDPVVMVSWYGAAAYCNWRSRHEGKQICYDLSTWQCDFSRHGYRLPTEAEWEYATRGGEHNPYYRFPWGDTISHSQANYHSNSYYLYDISPTRGYHPAWDDCIEPYTATVGTFQANGYGLYNLAGNVLEWCNDRYAENYYSLSPCDNPRGPDSGDGRVLRGGAWCYTASYCRLASRLKYFPAVPSFHNGFRVVLPLR